MIFEIVVIVVGFFAGAVASVAGFGIGSLLTPLLALQMDTRLAVAAVAIPHFMGTLLRFWMLRSQVDRKVLIEFGIMSALGGLTGALLHAQAESIVLTLVFGALLVFAGLTGITGLAQRMRLGGWMGWVAGVLSGLFGGLVGNQGGIRSAALLGFDLSKQSFVATATAIALIVDVARVPVYVATQTNELLGNWPVILAAAVGVVGGTLAGSRLPGWIRESTFRTVVSAIILVLGLAVLAGAAANARQVGLR